MTLPTSSSLTVHPTCLVAQDSDLRGQITLGAHTIIHPKASIQALGGPIIIGQKCMVEEGTKIVNRGGNAMRIGDGNVFMVGCSVESPSVGDNNVFQPGSKTAGVTVSHNCTIGAGTVVVPESTAQDAPVETLPPYTVVYGEASERRTWDRTGEESEAYLREKHLEYLSEILPKFNRMRTFAAPSDR